MQQCIGICIKITALSKVFNWSREVKSEEFEKYIIPHCMGLLKQQQQQHTLHLLQTNSFSRGYSSSDGHL
jgi:hypothetical protein